MAWGLWRGDEAPPPSSDWAGEQGGGVPETASLYCLLTA